MSSQISIDMASFRILKRLLASWKPKISVITSGAISLADILHLLYLSSM